MVICGMPWRLTAIPPTRRFDLVLVKRPHQIKIEHFLFLDGGFVRLTSTYPDNLFHAGDENLAITNLASAG